MDSGRYFLVSWGRGPGEGRRYRDGKGLLFSRRTVFRSYLDGVGWRGS